MSWFKRNESTMFDYVNNNKSTADKRLSKELINIFDQDIKKESLRGSDCSVIFYNKYNLVITAGCLELVKQHYEKQGFVVEYDLEEGKTYRERQSSTFVVRW